MCGIAGLLGVPLHLAKAAAPRMLAAMRHRGPDDSGLEILPAPGGPVPSPVLVHTRLAILDLTPAGHQPMADAPRTPAGKRNWITFNGEIFNFLELHDELARGGWQCRTRCDTEVILHAYRVWGESCVTRFRGMFAFCLIDADRGVAWLCRDRLGIKPLYLARPPAGGLLFASEVRALLAAGPELVSPKVRASALESFLAQGAVFGLESIVEGVELLAPGQSLLADWAGRPQKARTYWQMSFASEQQKRTPSASAAGRLREVKELAGTLREAVRLRLIADVPLGLFLSGGIDSGALAVLATESAKTRLQTISIGFDQPEFDETAAAGAVAQAMGTDHCLIRLTGEDILDGLAQALSAVDQPTVDGFNTYFVSRSARQAGLKVTLSGLGGDELFGGYASFRDVPRAVRWREALGRLGAARKPLARLIGWTGGRRGAKTAEMLTRRASSLHMYLLRRELFLPADRRALHALPAESDPCTGVPRAMMEELAPQGYGVDSVNQVSLFELSAYLQHMLLRDADVFSMAHGLELRAPLLDHELVGQVARLPGWYKQPDPRPKPLLLDAVGERLPSVVFTRPKRGFTFPWGAWLRGPLRKRAERTVSNGDAWSTLGFHVSTPRRLWDRFVQNDRRVSPLQVVALLVLEDFTLRHGLRQAA